MRDQPVELECNATLDTPGLLGWMMCWLSARPRWEADDGHPPCPTAFIPVEGNVTHYEGKVPFQDLFVEPHVRVDFDALETGSDGRASRVRVRSVLTVPPGWRSLGTYACLSQQGTLEAPGDPVSYRTFQVTGDLRVLWTRLDNSGRFWRAELSMSAAVVPPIARVNVMLVPVGPQMRFIGRLLPDRDQVQGLGVTVQRRNLATEMRLLLTVELADALPVHGVAFEVDDGPDGRLVGRGGVTLPGREPCPAARWPGQLAELANVVLTFAAAGLAVIVVLPRGRYPFAVWCALYLGWLLRTVTWPENE